MDRGDGRGVENLLWGAHQGLDVQAQGYGFEIVGRQVLVYRKRLGPAEVVSLLGIAKAFVDHVPSVVYPRYPAGGGTG